jgi:signal transduction histidine kinase
MKETIALASATHSTPVALARPWWRRRVLPFCVLGWTVFVGLALCWLLRANANRSVWIVREATSPATAAFEGRQAVFRADFGFQRVYPWILLSPYVALVAIYFPLERGRLRLGLPLNLGACALFVAASHAISVRTRVTVGNITIIRSEPAQAGSGQTNQAHAHVAGRKAAGPPDERMAKSPSLGKSVSGERLGLLSGRDQDLSYTGLTNWLVQLHSGANPPPPMLGLPDWSLWSSLLDLLAYGAVAGLAHAVHFYRRFRERERRALLLESNLAHARLDALRAQLQPHFLFNSLNAIAALLRRDPRLAEATLMSLSELLRLALRQSERQEIALREEMEFVRRYLEIQQTRFGDRLRVEQDIEPAALECSVPAFLLQPLVENAIRHGLEPDGNAGLVRLTAHRQDGRLVLTVEDDGVGFTSGPGDISDPSRSSLPTGANSLPVAASLPAGASDGSGGGTGIGLANLRARLATLYGAGQALELAPRAAGGVTVRIEIPWRPVIAAEALCAFNDL